MFEELIGIRTNEDIKQFLTKEGFYPEVIGRTAVGNLEIMGVRTGGSRKPAIVIKAGSPDEIGASMGLWSW